MKAYAAPARDDRRDGLIREHVEMARRIALRVARRVPSWMSSDDLVAAAMVGLTEAAERFDESRQESFVAFAERRIRGAVLDELRRGDIMPRRVRRQARRVAQEIGRLERRLGRTPEDEEVAAALGVSPATYREELADLVEVTLVDPERHRNAIDLHADGGESPAAAAERAQLAGMVRAGLTRLEPRDQTLLSLYYVEGFPYAEIGRVLGVTESRVCQLHSRALLRLRAAMGFTEEDDG